MTSRFGNWKKGFHDGVPVCLGYFAVSFAFGIQAALIGMSAFDATMLSFLNVTSAGQFAALDIIAATGSFLSLILVQLVVNIRYSLMSAALSQKVSPNLPIRYRLAMAYGITDEIFALSAMAPTPLSPWYTFGLISVAIPGWCGGTLAGAILGNVLPGRIISALGVAIFGMFIAIIIPDARDKKPVRLCVVASMVLSFAMAYAPVVKRIPSSYRLIIITLAVSLAAAVLFPVEEDGELSDGVDVSSDGASEKTDAGYDERPEAAGRAASRGEEATA